jgi:hypothetical protein
MVSPFRRTVGVSFGRADGISLPSHRGVSLRPPMVSPSVRVMASLPSHRRCAPSAGRRYLLRFQKAQHQVHQELLRSCLPSHHRHLPRGLLSLFRQPNNKSFSRSFQPSVAPSGITLGESFRVSFSSPDIVPSGAPSVVHFRSPSVSPSANPSTSAAPTPSPSGDPSVVPSRHRKFFRPCHRY